MIKLENITVQIASKILLENASAQIADGQKIGIVGHNGCGKTTLFKVLKGEHDVNAGEVFCSPNRSKAFVEQEIKEEDLQKPILEYVLSKDRKLAELRRLEQNARPEDLPEIMERLWLIEADSAEARTAEILVGLGFNQEDLSRPPAAGRCASILPEPCFSVRTFCFLMSRPIISIWKLSSGWKIICKNTAEPCC